MSFNTVNHLGTDIALLLFLPNVSEPGSHTIIYAHETEIEEGNSGRENREPQRDWLRLEQSCYYTLQAVEAGALRSGLAALGDKLVGVPVWCDRLTGGQWADRIHTPGYLVRLCDAELVAGTEYAPLLVGKLKNRPEIEAWTVDGGQGLIVVTEDSPPAYRLTPNATPDAATWPATLAPRWTRVIERSEDGRRYEQIGRGRERVVDGRETAVYWGQEADFLLHSRTQIRTLLGFFLATKGRTGAFVTPWWFQPGADEPATPHETTVRFAADLLPLDYTSGATAEVAINLWQLPWEITPPEGEAAVQPARAYLYTFAVAVPGGPLTWRFTDYESAITSGADTWFPAQIEHDRIAQGYMLDDEAVKLTSQVFASHPWMLVVKRMLEAPLTVEIREVNPASPATTRLVYLGEVAEVTGRGRRLSASTKVFGGMLDTMVPAFRVQLECNHDFCDAGCTLDEEDWTLAGTLDAVAGSVVDVTVTANPPAAVLVDDWLANGWIEKGAGATYESREIVRSEDLGGGVQRLTLSAPFRALAGGQVFAFGPNCTGTWSECKVKFGGNQINYGGHPRVKAVNPSLPTRETNVQGGKK